MSTVLCTARRRVVLHSGIVTETCIIDAQGERRIDHPPEFRCFLDVIDEDGAIAGVWDGAEYRDSLAEAAEWQADGYELVDHIASTWGRG